MYYSVKKNFTVIYLDENKSVSVTGSQKETTYLKDVYAVTIKYNYQGVQQRNQRFVVINNNSARTSTINVDDAVNLVTSFTLEQNYPNLFNPITSIKYAVGSMQYLSLKVYDILGNEVTTLINEYKEPEMYNIQFTTGNLASGIYFYQLFVSNLQSKDGKAGRFSYVKKMTLLR